MSMRKIFLPLSLVALLASCGGGGNTSESTKTPDSSTKEPTSSASSEPGEVTSGSKSETTAQSSESEAIPTPNVDKVTINFWTAFGQTPLEAVTKAAKDFHDIMLEKTKVDVTVNVTYEGSYDDILNKITQGFAPGNIPSLAIAYPDHVANYLGIGKDKVYELGAFMNDPNIGFGTQEFLGDKKSGEVYDEEDFIEAYLDEGRQYAYEGLYSMPLMKSSEVLFYNADAVRKIIELIPDTFLPKASRLSPEAFIDSLSWDDLIEVCRFAVENKSKILGTLKQPLYYDSDGNLFISKMFQNGIPYTTIDEEHKGHIAFESGDARTKAEKMVNDLAKASKDGLLTLRKNNADKYGSTAFAAEECIFTVGSSGGAGYTQPEGEAFDYGVTRVPASNNNPLYVSQGPTMAILNNPTISKEENDARAYYSWEFAKYLTNPDVNVYLCAWGSEGYVPVRYSAYETNIYQQFLNDGELLAETAKVLQNKIGGDFLNTDVFVGSATLRDQVGGVLVQVFNGTKDTTKALTDAIDYSKNFFK